MSRRINTEQGLFNTDRRDERGRGDRGERGHRSDRGVERETRGRRDEITLDTSGSISDYRRERQERERSSNRPETSTGTFLENTDFSLEANNCRFVKLVMVETGTYQDQVMRPMATDTGLDTINSLSETIMESGGTLTMADAASVASQLMMPSRDYERHVQIDERHGWDSRRFYFMLVLDWGEHHSSGVRREIISGYSNPIETLDTSYNGLFEESHCTFVPNAMMTLRLSRRNGVTGSKSSLSILNSSNILDSTSAGSLTNGYKMSPSVMLSAINKRNLFADYDDEGFIDTSARITAQTNTVARAFNNSARYIENTVNSYLDATRNALTDMSINESSVYNQARKSLQTPDYETSMFRSLLRRRCNTIDSTFTMDDLVTLFNFDAFDKHDKRVEISFLGKDSDAAYRSDYRDNTRSVTQSDENTIAANFISQSIVGLMLGNGFTKLGFVVESASSRSFSCDPLDEYLISPAGAWQCMADSQDDQIAMWQSFRYQFIERVLKVITNNNSMSVYLKVNASTFNSVEISISIDGMEEDFYAFPLFSDSLTSSLVTLEDDRFENMMNGLNSILSETSERITNNSPMMNRRRR